jgi:ferrous iron transport protein B
MSLKDPHDLLKNAAALRSQIGDLHDTLAASAYAESAAIAGQVVSQSGQPRRYDFDRMLDRIVTSKTFGMPIMIGLLALVLWITITGANIPSALLAQFLLGPAYGWLKFPFTALNAPTWLSGFLLDGVYMGLAWVVSVMLPPMAIFFPMFTLLEDFGYLPRVAFNLDRVFAKAGAHGKQALTMTMGFGCNAAGVVATRIIDSPRERLIAILTNNFSLCNGRWPTQILIATIFIGAIVPTALSGIAASLAVLFVALLGVGITFFSAWFLSKTVLRGTPTSFSLELPPYRPPRFWQTIYTSMIDRTLIVLWRAMVMAAPAGGIIWLLGNIQIGGAPLATLLVNWLNPLGMLMGLNGVILLAYVAAIPANEIVIPTVLMLTLTVARSTTAPGVMVDASSVQATSGILVGMGGWTLLTGINLMLFSLLHNPCSTTIMTIYRETKSWRWTTLSVAMPLAMGFAVTVIIAGLVHVVGLLV